MDLAPGVAARGLPGMNGPSRWGEKEEGLAGAHCAQCMGSTAPQSYAPQKLRGDIAFLDFY